MDLNNMGLQSMTTLETEQIEGGNLIRAVAGLVIDTATGFWDGLVAGFSAGAR